MASISYVVIKDTALSSAVDTYFLIVILGFFTKPIGRFFRYLSSEKEVS